MSYMQQMSDEQLDDALWTLRDTLENKGMEASASLVDEAGFRLRNRQGVVIPPEILEVLDELALVPWGADWDLRDEANQGRLINKLVKLRRWRYPDDYGKPKESKEVKDAGGLQEIEDLTRTIHEMRKETEELVNNGKIDWATALAREKKTNEMWESAGLEVSQPEVEAPPAEPSTDTDGFKKQLDAMEQAIIRLNNQVIHAKGKRKEYETEAAKQRDEITLLKRTVKSLQDQIQQVAVDARTAREYMNRLINVTKPFGAPFHDDDDDGGWR